VKIPGDGRAYKVGTIEVRNTDDPAWFSVLPTEPQNIRRAQDVSAAYVLPAYTEQSPPAFRQVVVLQITNDVTEELGPQRFFYGENPLTEGEFTFTNARAISVWPAADPEDVRIAICGETYDPRIPLSQAPSGWPLANSTASSGYIAVFDGNLALLWTHHFFGGLANASAAVTDLSIRREPGEEEGLQDVVTYCGISTHGNTTALAGTPLAPVRFFAAPSAFTSPGNVNHGAQQWDGFVGRLRRDTATNTDFHAIVGGPAQDGFFGLVEVDRNNFVVVGQTQLVLSTSNPLFPAVYLTPILGTSTVGSIIWFDAAPTRTGGNLLLQNSVLVGSLGFESDPTRTELRDVCVGWGATTLALGFPPTLDPLDAVYFCGVTNDPSLQSFFPLATRGPAYGGGNDGFVGIAVLGFQPAAPTDPVLLPWTFSYSGLEGDDGYTGVGMWNEFVHHVSVTGYATNLQAQLEGVSPPTATGYDLLAASYFFDNSPQGSPVTYDRGLHPIRMAVAAGTQDDFPAVLGQVEAMRLATSAPAFDTFVLSLSQTNARIGRPWSGGVAVDPRGRTTVVGSTESDDLLAVSGGRGPDVSGGGAPSLPDAARAKFDLVPVHVGRTDGTGDPLPFFPPGGLNGGTTPACALHEYGIQINGASTGPRLHIPAVTRMLIDYQGDAPSTPRVTINNASIILSRPAADGGDLLGAMLQLGLPVYPSPVVLLPQGIDLWITDPGAVLVISTVLMPFDSYRLDLSPNLPSGVLISAQLLVGRLTPFSVPSGCTADGTAVASPAIWIDN
jgi:hypothetical protein